MTRYTKEDFANAQFAEHPDPLTVDARYAARMGDRDYPWLLDGVPGNTDEAMAISGWAPVPTRPAITAKDYWLALDGRDTQYALGFIDAIYKFGGEVIPDPEPTNVEKITKMIREADKTALGTAVALAEHLDANGVKAGN